MGKTKTAFIGETLEEPKKSKEKKPKKTESAETIDSIKESTTSNKERVPRVRGKKYKASVSKIDKTKLYELKDAIKVVKDANFSSFDSTVELHLVVKKTGLNAQVELPHSSGKTKRIEVANDETIKQLQNGKVDFDILLATAEMMPKLVPFARILGPKGLMPNPKNGTIIKSAKDAEKFGGNTISVKTEKKAPIVHTIIGKSSMSDADLLDNAEAILNAVNKRQILKAYISTTMSPSAKVKIN